MIITASTFFCYTCFAKNKLTPSVAFTALSLFGLLKGPLDQFTTMMSQIQNCKVSIDRLEGYLGSSETEKHPQLLGNKTDSDGFHMLAFENATLAWSSSDATFKLIDLDLRLEIGQFYLVLGPTGSGKTSLLLALLGEMTKLRGTVYSPNANAQGRITGSTSDIAYCSQEPWILNSTIRDNIIFGSAFNAVRYQEVLTSCALQQDLAALEAGDDTLVREKGAALSGGQKHRVALARAIYSDARLVLLDDVLNTIDSHISKWIFDKALCGPTMKGRTCIFVTHDVRLCLSAQHSTIILDKGRVTANGPSLELLKAGILDGYRKKALSADDANEFDAFPTERSIRSTGISEQPKTQASEDPATKDKNKDHEQDHLLEKKAVGRISIKTSLSYMRAMGGFTFWICVLIAFVARQGVQALSNIWITWWSNASTEAPTHPLSLPLSADHSTYYSTIYIALVACYMLVSFFRNTIVSKGSITASHNMHSRMLNAVVRARFAFFDFTSLGQLLNRFSKDIEVLDQ
jgi:ABC-type multidrug transport system fused ATPase/permease subunit